MPTPDGCQCARRSEYGGDGSGRPYCSDRIEKLEKTLRLIALSADQATAASPMSPSWVLMVCEKALV